MLRTWVLSELGHPDYRIRTLIYNSTLLELLPAQ